MPIALPPKFVADRCTASTNSKKSQNSLIINLRDLKIPMTMKFHLTLITSINKHMPMETTTSTYQLFLVR
jgi:hypothetical protein